MNLELCSQCKVWSFMQHVKEAVEYFIAVSADARVRQRLVSVDSDVREPAWGLTGAYINK